MSGAQPVALKQGGSFVDRFRQRLADAPVETLAATLLGPWLMTTFMKGAWKLLTESDEHSRKYGVAVRKAGEKEEGVAEDQRTIKYRGKSFVQVESKEKVDLSWIGAAPYWIPVSLIGLEGLMMFRHGAEYFKKRGYSPAQRHVIQAYVFFAILPIVDLVSGDDWANPTKDQQKNRRLAYRFRLPLYMWTIFEYIITIATFKIVLDPTNNLSKRSRFALIMQLGEFLWGGA